MIWSFDIVLAILPSAVMCQIQCLTQGAGSRDSRKIEQCPAHLSHKRGKNPAPYM